MDQAVIRTSGFPKASCTGGRSKEAVLGSASPCCAHSLTPVCTWPHKGIRVLMLLLAPPSVGTSREGLESRGSQVIPVTLHNHSESLLTLWLTRKHGLFPSLNGDKISQLTDAKARVAEQWAGQLHCSPNHSCRAREKSRKLTDFSPEWETQIV